MADRLAIQRRIGRLRNGAGVVVGLAIDHRDSMVVALRKAGVGEPSEDLISAIKADVCRAVAPLASTVMIDARFGRRAFAEGSIPVSAAVIMPLEAQGYELIGDGHATSLMDDFTPRIAAVEFGADACKLLLPFRADSELAPAQRDTAGRAVELAHNEGLPLVLEPVVPRARDESPGAFDAAYSGLVLDSIEALASVGADVLKLPFPSRTSTGPDAEAACRALHRACGATPWVLLGGGAGIDEIEAQLRLAMAIGAAGFLVGRSIWSPALVVDPRERQRRITESVLPAFGRLAAVAGAARG